MMHLRIKENTYSIMWRRVGFERDVELDREGVRYSVDGHAVDRDGSRELAPITRVKGKWRS